MLSLRSASFVMAFLLAATFIQVQGVAPDDGTTWVIREWDGKGWAALRIRVTPDAVQIPGSPPHLIEFVANITYAPTDWAVGCGISPGYIEDSSSASASIGLLGLDGIAPPVTLGPFFTMEGAEGWYHQWLVTAAPGDYVYICSNPSPDTLHTRLQFHLAQGVFLVADTFGTSNGAFREKDFRGTLNVHAQVGNGPAPDGVLPWGNQATVIENGLVHLEVEHRLFGVFEYYYRGLAGDNLVPTVVPYPATIWYEGPNGVSEWGDEYYLFSNAPPGSYDMHVGFYADADPTEYGFVRLVYADILLP